MRKLSLTLLILISLYTAFINTGHAGYSSSLGVSLDVYGQPIQPGHIVSLIGDNYLLSFTSYDTSLYGVVVENPTISLEDRSLDDYALVVTSGEEYVKVSGINGPIKVGDYITSSKIPGVGQKATQSGQVIGIALEEYNFEDPNQISEVLISVNPNNVFVDNTGDSNLLKLLQEGFKVPFLTPLTSFRYLIAAFIIVLTFVLSFSSFGRMSTNSIAAIGRNPLASGTIKAAVVLNFVFTLGIICIGLVISYLILSL